MRRREFVAGFAAAIAGVMPSGAGSQSRKPRLGMLMALNADAPLVVERRGALSELGWIEGRTIDIIWRFADGDEDRMPALAAELVALDPDVILTHSNQGAHAAARATNTIPIVVGASGEETLLEIAGGLARPKGNVTGLTLVSHAQQAKCIELLKEAHPTVRRIAILVDAKGGTYRDYPAVLSVPLAPLELDMIRVDAPDESALETAFAMTKAARVDGILVVSSPMFNRAVIRRKISELAVAQRVPLVTTVEESAHDGAFLALGTDYSVLIRRSAIFVDKILKGAKPGDLPIERPTVFRLVINLKTAKELGITVPPSLLARADEVIE